MATGFPGYAIIISTDFSGGDSTAGSTAIFSYGLDYISNTV
jgi:hypothetical protein